MRGGVRGQWSWIIVGTQLEQRTSAGRANDWLNGIIDIWLDCSLIGLTVGQMAAFGGRGLQHGKITCECATERAWITRAWMEQRLEQSALMPDGQFARSAGVK